MLDQLPRLLTKGVTATREGLVFSDDAFLHLRNLLTPTELLLDGNACNFWSDGQPNDTVLNWADTAERLRYREGEPWCFLNGYGVMTCDTYYFGGNTSDALHRLAAILCDDAEAFRVLHWCVTELGGKDE